MEEIMRGIQDRVDEKVKESEKLRENDRIRFGKLYDKKVVGREVSLDNILIGVGNRVKEIEESRDYLDSVSKEPKNIFKDYGKYYGKHTAIIDVIDRDTLLDLQIYIGNILNNILQEWLGERGVEGSYTIRVREPRQLYSIYAVYIKNIEIIAFRLEDYCYDIRGESIEKIEKRHGRVIKNRDKYIDKYTKHIEKVEDVREKPKKYAKGIRAKLRVLFKRSKVEEGLDRTLKYYSKKLEAEMVEKELELNNYERNMEKAEKMRKYLEDLLPFFEGEGIGEWEKVEEYKLY